MITKSFSIPSPSCVHSIVREMTPDEIRQMNELLAARRKWFIAQINQHNVNARLDAIAAAFVWATAEEREALIEEAAELLTLDNHEWQTPSIKDQLDDAGFGHSGQL
jgi:hypothetical protein